MKIREVIFPVFLILLAVLLNGCVIFALGAGAAGGYAISRDTLEGFSDKSLDQVWNVGREVLGGQGLVTLEDKTHGRIEAKIDDSKVRLDISQVSPKSVRMQVKARKFSNMFPDMRLSERTFTLMMNELK